MENKIEFLIGDELTPYDKYIKMIEEEIERNKTKSNISAIEMMIPYQRLIDAL